ncbi:hypothetical protein Pcinc_021447 [Petrolisthes cinctipes]|uniref:Uncharacterized protein n=1 Tax=Petrolisthes cinctipes TaxID=88211 RepID=A0AAE1FHM3_PETCI|nr:hypothetical protein Pcinc_021447 [Petrolisthes cinctipes]
MPRDERNTSSPMEKEMLRKDVTDDDDDDDDDDTLGTPEQRESILLVRLPKLKREKSYSETLERRRRRVKFSTSGLRERCHCGHSGV